MTVHTERFRFTLTVTTPMFIEVDNAHPELRSESIRGVLRFWLRALVGREVGDDLAALHKIESALFGSVRGTERSQSPVTIRIVKPFQNFVPKGPVDWLDQRPGIGYLLAQGLSVPGSRNRLPEVLRSHFAVGQQAEVDVIIRHGDKRVLKEISSLLLSAFWFASAFGGLGARTHRGFGGFDLACSAAGISSVRADQLDIWTEHIGASVENLLSLLHQADHRRFPTTEFRPIQFRPPTYPVFDDDSWTGVFAEDIPDWATALNRLGMALRDNLAPIQSGRGTASVEHKTIVSPVSKGGTPQTTVFGRGAFGLPVGYPKGNVKVQEFTRGSKGNGTASEARRSSPVWVRVVKLTGQETKVAVCAFGFHSSFLPTTHRMVLEVDRRKPIELSLDQKTFVARVNAWLAAFDRDFN
jgi:CRISPR type III-B/RAMP module RAMP protein Cmr1